MNIIPQVFRTDDGMGIALFSFITGMNDTVDRVRNSSRIARLDTRTLRVPATRADGCGALIYFPAIYPLTSIYAIDQLFQ